MLLDFVHYLPCGRCEFSSGHDSLSAAAAAVAIQYSDTPFKYDMEKGLQ